MNGGAFSVAERRAIAAEVLARHGRTDAEEIGIKLDDGTPGGAAPMALRGDPVLGAHRTRTKRRIEEDDMADNTKRSGGGKGRVIGILVVVILAVGAWWVFDQWSSQPPSTMPAVGDESGMQVDETPPDMKGDPPSGYSIEEGGTTE